MATEQEGFGSPESIGESMVQPPVNDVVNIAARRLMLGGDQSHQSPEPPEPRKSHIQHPVSAIQVSVNID